MATGLVGDPWFPINKNLWTSSYVLLTTGTSLLVLAFCYSLIRVRKFQEWTFPFQVLGANALGAFIVSELLARAMAAERWWTMLLPDVSQGADLRTFLHEQLFMPWAAPELASALWALAYLALIICLMTVFYRLRLRITV